MRAKSAAGNHPLCIMRDTEDYEQLKLGLRDIISEASDIQKNGLLIKGTKYEFDFLLGGDWKFLACVVVLTRQQPHTRAYGVLVQKMNAIWKNSGQLSMKNVVLERSKV